MIKTCRKTYFVIILLVMPAIIIIGFPGQLPVTIPQLQVINSNVVRTFEKLPSILNVTNVSAVLIKPLSKPAPVKPKKYDLIINSYMNSGSRFTGQLFGFRTQAFYIYEPLWKFSVWDYYHADNWVCSSTQGSVNCAKGSVTNVNRERQRGPVKVLVKNVKPNSTIVDMMLGVLDDMYSCNFSRIESMFVPTVQDGVQYAGPAWNEYRTCTKSRGFNRAKCLKKQEEKCKNASHIVTKVLRLTMGSYEKLMQKKPNLKIIQLFRNPFAIINSRTESRGYPVKDFVSNAAVLCKKMFLDYDGAVRLAKMFPGRVKMVFYEDIKSNVTEKIAKLNDFIGMESNIQEIKKWNKVTVNKGISNTPGMTKTRSSDNAHWWRSHMSYLRYQGVKGKCAQVMKVFHLTDFKNRDELLKLNIPEMDLPDEFRIK